MVNFPSKNEHRPSPSEVNPSLNLYTVFHLNLYYSSIEEEQRSEVIQSCYWPLVRLAKRRQLPLGIEATGMTLEAIASIDPDLLTALRELFSSGCCELIGSGYSQIVGPLVPADVNAANLRIGHRVYENLLGIRPKIALVNEQAFSAGLVHHYLESGYQAIMMEWDNPAQQHPEWDPEWRYFPQYACGHDDEVIPLVWNKSIAFQQFQRYAHGETCLDEYLGYLSKHASEKLRMFPLYANDAEIFDFRPKRYATEAMCQVESEWSRITHVFERILKDSRFSLILPSQALDFLHLAEAGRHLRLESVQQPIPVKKQGKYNILRWAVTGRSDSIINAACWKACDVLKSRPDSREEDWQELCYLWSSDFRTHITSKRWQAYEVRLKAFLARIGVGDDACPLEGISFHGAVPLSSSSPFVQCYDQARNRVSIETEHVRVTLNCRRGLAIESLCFKEVSSDPLIMTLPHGFYDDISKGADFYSGHLVLETPGQHKITDLGMLDSQIQVTKDGKEVLIQGSISTPLGKIHKTVTIGQAELKIAYELAWETLPLGSLRLGHVTLNPTLFDPKFLYYETHNGGARPERFPIQGRVIDHGRPVSFLVSASEALGMTGGSVVLGDQHHRLSVQVNQGNGYLAGLMTYVPVGQSYFCRLSLSGAECDDTSLNGSRTSFPRQYEITLSAKKVVQPVLDSVHHSALLETA